MLNAVDTFPFISLFDLAFNTFACSFHSHTFLPLWSPLRMNSPIHPPDCIACCSFVALVLLQLE